MSSKEELWRQAYEWMQRYGDQMPDATARARDRLIGQRPSYYVKPTPRLSLIEELENWKWQPLQASPADLTARQTIDDLERTLMSAFDDLDRLPDSFSNQVGQLGSPLDWPSRWSKPFVGFDTAAKPEPQGTYVDPDGTQHDTKLLEDTDEMCSCGATWRHDDCEHT